MQVILAADVLYEDRLTEAFCTFLEALLRASRTHRAACRGRTQHACTPPSTPPSTPPCTPHAACDTDKHTAGDAAASEPATAPRAARCAPEEPLVLVAAEKRFVFTVDARDVRAPAFEHFLRCVDAAGEPPRQGGEEGGAAAAAQGREGRGLCGRFVDVDSIPRAVGGGGRGRHLVLVQLWLAE